MTNFPGESPNPFTPEVVEAFRRQEIIALAQDFRQRLKGVDGRDDETMRQFNFEKREHFVISSRASEVVPVEHERITFGPKVRAEMTDGIALLRVRLPNLAEVNDVFIEVVRPHVELQTERYLINGAGIFTYGDARDLAEDPMAMVGDDLFSVVGSVGEVSDAYGHAEARFADPLEAISVLLGGEYTPMRTDNRRPNQTAA